MKYIVRVDDYPHALTGQDFFKDGSRRLEFLKYMIKVFKSKKIKFILGVVPAFVSDPEWAILSRMVNNNDFIPAVHGYDHAKGLANKSYEEIVDTLMRSRIIMGDRDCYISPFNEDSDILRRTAQNCGFKYFFAQLGLGVDAYAPMDNEMARIGFRRELYNTADKVVKEIRILSGWDKTGEIYNPGNIQDGCICICLHFTWEMALNIKHNWKYLELLAKELAKHENVSVEDFVKYHKKG